MTNSELKEWYVSYRKNRDIMLKKIESIADNESHIIIKSKDGKHEKAVIQEQKPELNSIVELLKPFKKDEYIIAVILNKKNHIDLLVKEWNSIIEYKNLTILFVNPELVHDNKWLIKPAVHNIISDKSSLKTGIMSLAESVELC